MSNIILRDSLKSESYMNIFVIYFYVSKTMYNINEMTIKDKSHC